MMLHLSWKRIFIPVGFESEPIHCQEVWPTSGVVLGDHFYQKLEIAQLKTIKIEPIQCQEVWLMDMMAYGW